MYLEGPFFAPRRLIAAIVAITLVPFAALLWLGWRFLDQDRIVQRQHMRDRLESSAELAVAAIERAIGSSEQALRAGQNQWPEGAVALEMEGTHVEVFPRQRVAYLPQAPELPHASEAVFADGDELEFRQHNWYAAIRFFTKFSDAPDPAVRAAAMLRLGRNLKNAGRVNEALAVYERMSRIEGVAVGSAPAALAARYARCALLAGAGRTDQLRSEARGLAHDLYATRWPLSAPVYAIYAADVSRWTGEGERAVRRSEILADGVATLSAQLQRIDATAGRKTLFVDGQMLTALWHRSERGVRALLASKAFVETEWLSAATIVERQQHVTIGIRDGAGSPLSDDGTEVRAQRLTRNTAETSLPWNVTITTETTADQDGALAQRRRLMVAGFVLVVGMMAISSYTLIRAVSREMAVARMKSDFVSAVSHEFRTPLTSLRQFTDMLLDKGDMNDERRRLCYEAQARATGRLTRLVESLLDFGRLESGSRTYQFEMRDCAELVRKTVEEFRAGPQGARCSIRVHTSGPAPAKVDPEAVSRALWNLLENAVKYSPDDPRIEVEADVRSGSVSIVVRDNGIGIAAGEQSSIFGRFHRGEQARNLGIQGTGLGLTIVEQIAKAHGGRVELDSEPGTGSTFTIVLPRSES